MEIELKGGVSFLKRFTNTLPELTSRERIRSWKQNPRTLKEPTGKIYDCLKANEAVVKQG